MAANGLNLGRQLLHAAEESESLNVISSLIDEGADVNTKDEDGHTALIYLAEHGNTAACRHLLDKGADLKAISTDGNALHAAAYNGHVDTCILLLDNGADLAAKDSTGDTCLHDAASEGSAEICKLLLRGGADPCTKTFDGETALDIAQRKGDRYLEVIALLKNAVRNKGEKNNGNNVHEGESLTEKLIALESRAAVAEIKLELEVREREKDAEKSQKLLGIITKERESERERVLALEKVVNELRERTAAAEEKYARVMRVDTFRKIHPPE